MTSNGGTEMEKVRIQTEATFLLNLIKDIQQGRAVPANFQRPYVWKEEDVIALWHSIINGYPLGAFLWWQPADKRPHGKPTLGPLEISPDSSPDIILDGQNRLVTIAWSMTNTNGLADKGYPGSDIFLKDRELVLDPYRKTVRFMDRKDVRDFLMPVHCIFDNVDTNRFFRQKWKEESDDRHMEWIEEVGYALRDARVVKTTILNATAEQAKEAFLHIARVGVPMTEEDFNQALRFED